MFLFEKLYYLIVYGTTDPEGQIKINVEKGDNCELHRERS